MKLRFSNCCARLIFEETTILKGQVSNDRYDGQSNVVFGSSCEAHFTGEAETRMEFPRATPLFVVPQAYIKHRFHMVKGDSSEQWHYDVDHAFRDKAVHGDTIVLLHLFPDNKNSFGFSRTTINCLDEAAKAFGEDETALYFFESINFPPQIQQAPIRVYGLEGMITIDKGEYFLTADYTLTKAPLRVKVKCDGKAMIPRASRFESFQADGCELEVFGKLEMDRVEEDGSSARCKRTDSAQLHNACVTVNRVVKGRDSTEFAWFADKECDPQPSRTLKGTHMELTIDGLITWQDLAAEQRIYIPGICTPQNS